MRYVVENTLCGTMLENEPISPWSTDTDETDDAPESPQSLHITVGLGGEDKHHGKLGEPQVVAAMIIKATELGIKAINAGKKFHVFGYVRKIEDSNTI